MAPEPDRPTSARVPPPPSTAHRGLRIGLLAVAVLLLFSGLLIRDVVRIRTDVKAGQARLRHLQLTQLESHQTVEASFGTADRRLREAASVARDSPWLKLLTPLPKVGRQIGAVRDLTAAAAQVADIGYHAATTARAQLDAPRSGPADRLRLIDSLRREMSVAAGRLAQVNVGATGRLTGSLAAGRAELVAKLAQARTQLADGLQLTGTLRSMLAGPRTYLVLAGNNAEMRSSGITTAAGLVKFNGGDLVTGKFIPTFELYLPKGVAVPPDLALLYGAQGLGQEWRETNTSPNWPAVAGIYAQMSAKSVLGHVDGVLFVDVVTLRSLLQVVGPVTVEGTIYTADNVEQKLLYENYVLYPTLDQNNARRDVQSQVANAAFAALRSGSFSLPRLAKALGEDIKGRHLLAWSSDPGEQAMWTKLAADGTVGPNDLMVTAQNLSASKLDYFIDPAVDIKVSPQSDHQQIDMTITITNPRRGASSPYIEGGVRGQVVPGDHRIYLLLYLPGSAYTIINHDPQFVTGGVDGGMQVAGLIYTVAYGQTRDVHITFSVPLTQTYVRLVPSGRLHPVGFTLNGNYHVNDGKVTLLPF